MGKVNVDILALEARYQKLNAHQIVSHLFGHRNANHSNYEIFSVNERSVALLFPLCECDDNEFPHINDYTRELIWL